MNGWWKFHRKMLEHPVWSLPHAQRSVFLTILCKANHTTKDWFDGTQRVPLGPGELITSQDHLAESAGTTRQVVRDTLTALIRLGTIGTKTRTKRYTQITVVNWPLYQGEETDENQEENHKRTKREPSENHSGRMKEGKKNILGQNHNGFDRWWEAYPKKVGKQQAILQWDRLNPDESLTGKLLDAILKQRGIVKAMVEGDRAHILDPERWLKYRRWEDDLTVNTQQQSMYPTL